MSAWANLFAAMAGALLYGLGYWRGRVDERKHFDALEREERVRRRINGRS